MNLEALALARADEQMHSEAWRYDEPTPKRAAHRGPRAYADPAPRQRAYSLTARKLVCHCGNCHTCKNREAMRRYRGSPKSTAFPRCTTGGCCRRQHAKGLCLAHYRQVWRGGKVHPLRREPRTARPETIERARAKLAAKGITIKAA